MKANRCGPTITAPRTICSSRTIGWETTALGEAITWAKNDVPICPDKVNESRQS